MKWVRASISIAILGIIFHAGTERSFGQPEGGGAIQVPKLKLAPELSPLEQELAWLRCEQVRVTAASLIPESIPNAPATIRVITQRQIRERGYRSLWELLQDLPGVEVLDHVQAEAKNRVTFRGIPGNGRFLILQDGIRIDSPTSENVLPIAENFPLYYAKQVEVLFGPASAIYGADAFSAVINIVTRNATRKGTVEFSTEIGDFSSRRADLYSAKRFSDFVALSLGGHYQETDGADLDKAYRDEYRQQDLTFFDGSVAVPLSERNPYDGSYHSFSTWAKLELGEDLTLGWNQSIFKHQYSEGSLPSLTDYDESGSALLMTGYAKYQYELNPRTHGHVQVNYSRYEQEPESHFNNTITSYTDGFVYSLGERYQLEGHINYEVSERSTAIFGLSLEHFEAVPHTADLETPYDRDKDPDDQGQFHLGSRGTLPVEIFNLSYNQVGAFAQSQTQWNDDLSTTVGIRVDHNEDYGESVNPRAGVVYQSSDETTWKALYGQAFLAPAPQLRFENFGTFAFPRPDGLFQSFFFRVPNPDLDPERLQTGELSISHSPRPDFHLGLTGYYTRVDDMILPAPNVPPVSDFVPGGFIDFTEASQNVGELDAYGAEFTASQSFHLPTTRVNVWGSFSYVDGELTNELVDTTSDLPFTSRELVKLGVTVNYKDRAIFTSRLRWSGGQTGFPVAEGEVIETPSYMVVDVFGEIRSRNQVVSLFCQVNNLLDESYFSGGRSNPFVFTESPQDPRWISAGVRIDL